jgi:predicted TIM-barrel fold metal-dependent hydrolase
MATTAFDAYLNLPPPPAPEGREIDPGLQRLFRNSKAMLHGATVEEMVADLEGAGIAGASLNTAMPGAAGGPYSVGLQGTDEQAAEVLEITAAVVARNPGRFQLSVSLDPSGVMNAVRHLERAVREFGARSCLVFPSLVGLPPNHAAYFPVYAKCVELDVPIKLNAGIPGPIRFGELQRPIYLDEVCVAFPELRIAATHIGAPWTEEMAALLRKHRNLALITSGYAPSRVPAIIWEFARSSAGSTKLMWASDYPALSIDRATAEGWQAPLPDAGLEGYMGGNARAFFGIDDA